MNNPAPATPTIPSKVFLRGCDSFLLALDTVMQRTGQGEHLGQTIVELGAGFNLEKFQNAVRELTTRHPILIAPIRRTFFSGAYWKVPAQVNRSLPVSLWREKESPGQLFPKAEVIESSPAFLVHILNTPLAMKREWNNVRFDLIEQRDGQVLLAATWTHLLFDGIGAELLLIELARLSEPNAPAHPRAIEPPKENLPVRQQMDRSKAFVQRFSKLVRTKFTSLGGPVPKPGKACCQIVTLDARDSAEIKNRAQRSSLLNMPFYLACATRAHARVLQQRGITPESFIISLPVQTRRKGASAIFQNQVSILFFHFTPDDLTTVETAVHTVQNQFSDMTRHRLDESFSTVLNLMRRLPSWLYTQFLRRQFGGELTCFFHSHTGAFAPDLKSVCGAELTNGYHVPTVSTPPGTGIFLSERNGLLTITFSWREGVISDSERKLLLSQFIEDLMGGVRTIAVQQLAEAV
ncbi:MAG: hypothetical protein H0X66_01195 [Verrucomicrobia bacterium]|nr:hypothetical protein [Verrucomicrobiota bacterium]